MGIKDERKFENLHKLIELLLDHPQGLTKAEIARKLGIHRSTAAEYLDSMEGINAPVYEISPGRYTIDRDRFEVKISVDMHEALALHLASRLLTTRTDKHNPNAASALRKLGRSLEKLAPLISEHMKRSADVLDADDRRRDPIFMQALETVTRAWSRHRKVRLTHEMEDGSIHSYVFAPYFIEPYAVGRTMHVIGNREPPNKVRTFKIERIRTIELLEDTRYEIPATFDPRAQLKDAWGIWFTERAPELVKLHFNRQVAKRVSETVWHHTQKISEQPDGSIIWTAQVAEWQEMVSWVRGWGADVEVLEPKELRNALTREAHELAELYKAVEMKKQFIAHLRKKDKEPQYLSEHLIEVSKLAGQFASKIGLKEGGEILGLLHDLGKASREFQDYIQAATGLIDPDSDHYVDAKAKKGKVDHSSAGAQVIYNHFWKKGSEERLVAQVLALSIASHHSGLIDCLAPNGDDNFTRRLEKPEENTHVSEALSNLDNPVKQAVNRLLNDQELVKQIVEKFKSLKDGEDSKDTYLFKCGLLMRYLLSCLLDADRLNTSDFEFPGNAHLRNHSKYQAWETLIERLNTKISEFENKSDRNEVDELRSRVSQSCLDFSTKPKGIYQLTVPTGGGKTLASLRFALNHAAHRNIDRVFYVIPYTSIIDQNADVVREILEDKDKNGNYLNKIVLEHHSNLTPDEETHRQSLLSENWDAPIVLTTQVQFLEALFGSGTRSARRMHQLANSVIIFDEIQTLPVRCVHMFNVTIRLLVHTCGATVVLCTATQPLLDKVDPKQRALMIQPEQKIIAYEKELFRKLKRVEVFDRRKIGGWTDEEVADLVDQELRQNGSVLIVVNTKKSARSVYQVIVQKINSDVYHLSTNMCPAHRLNVLEKVKGKLKNEEPVICVSTQLIEAGVDIDFGSVIRYLAGMDSIAQAAGRCNRNGIREGLGNVQVVNPSEENTEKLKDIKIGIEKAQRILDDFKDTPEAFGDDIIGLSAMETYYKYYFHERKDEMRYKVSKDSSVGREDDLFNLLAANTISNDEHDRVKGSVSEIPFKQSFQTASKAFRAIDSLTRGVIVPFGDEGEEIIKDLCGAYDLEKQYSLIKRAQRYSVNLYSYEFGLLANQRVIREVQEGAGIYYLDDQYYSEKFGWSNDPVSGMKTQIV
jgi:CRISPR-associated endonuclease/helicase Cas3